MYVIGTAGHVDHGKSTLIHALTGIDPDRLPEEKERSMTIDLGFAWMELPSGRQVSIVDVPGHERFVGNMLAGAGGIDVAILVIAADEGVMPQTTEHLAILDLLQVEHAVVIITKSDLADKDLLDLVAAETEELLRGTSLEDSPVVPVSSVTRLGLDVLKRTLDKVLDACEPRKDFGRPRLLIDRSFAVAGFGTIVTGTLIDGTLNAGQQVELVPSGKSARIRGLQTHKQKLDAAKPGSRVAVNLSGIAHNEITRGEVLTTPGWLKPTTIADIRLRLIARSPRPLRHNAGVVFYAFTSECEARIRMLEGQEIKPGEIGLAQVHLDRLIPLVKGDAFVLRSPDTTIGGGRVLDAHPQRHRRGHQQTIERLQALGTGSQADGLVRALEAESPLTLIQLAQRVNATPADSKAALNKLAGDGLIIVLGSTDDAPAYSATAWARLVELARVFLQAYHKEHPLRRGASREEVRSRLRVTPQLFPLILARMTADGTLTDDESFVRLPQHSAFLSDMQKRQVEQYMRALRSQPFNPPTDTPVDAELVAYLADEGKVVRMEEGVVFAAEAYQQAVEKITQYIREKGKATAAELRDLLGTSRKYIMPLLTYMDRQHITRRVGDDRVLR